MVIRALVVDDEPPARDELAYLLSRHRDLEVLQAGSATAALEMIRQAAPDLVFQDIQMPGKDGFHVLEESLSCPRPPLFVFVTAFNEYAIRAFEANAVDYLLKPVSEERLGKSLDRVRRQLRSRDDGTGRETLERFLAGLGRGSVARLPVEHGGRIQLVPIQQVVLCEAEEKRVVALTDQGRLPCHGLPTLCQVEDRLAGLPFFRANRSSLVNLERIAELSPWFGGKYHLVMDDQERTEVVVSRNRAGEFKRRLGL
jgi:two-component system LytT family response regulator